MATYVSYHVGGYVDSAPQHNAAVLIDTDAATRTFFDEDGVLSGTEPLSDIERAVLALSSSAGSPATLRRKIVDALDVNDTYLALEGPSQDQHNAQTVLLTREINGVIRLICQLADTGDT